jgi:hypothetical protein
MQELLGIFEYSPEFPEGDEIVSGFDHGTTTEIPIGVGTLDPPLP